MKRYIPNGSESSLSSSFGIEVNGATIAYTYVRKNACSTFKRFFRKFSRFDFSSEVNDLIAMRKYHKINIEDMKDYQYKIFVYRDPVVRLISVYNNKFVQRDRNKDIFKNFFYHTGMNPHDCTFSDFVNHYVLKVPLKNIDPHLWPMYKHLFPVEYNAVISIDDLCSDMSAILGEKVARDSFLKKNNSTRSLEKINSNLYENDMCFISSKNLNSLYKENGFMPDVESYVSNEMHDILNKHYEKDYSFIKSLI